MCCRLGSEFGFVATRRVAAHDCTDIPIRAKNLRPGGKSLSGDQKHSPVVQVRVSKHTRDKLRVIAKARGMSVSKLSRKVLDEFVAREPPG